MLENVIFFSFWFEVYADLTDSPFVVFQVWDSLLSVYLFNVLVNE